MGYVDYDLLLSNAQAITASTQSTSYVDAIQAGWGQNEEVYAKFMVTTAYSGTAGNSVTFAVQIAQDTTFATMLTVASAILGSTNLTAKSIPLVVKLPAAMMTGQLGKSGGDIYQPDKLPYRYIRAYYTLGESHTTISVSCMLMKDTQVTIDKVM